VASESRNGWEMGIAWIDSPKPLIAVSGWATLGCTVSIRDDAELDLKALKQLLQRVQKSIHQEPDLVRYQMNSFTIAVGGYVRSLSETAIQIAQKIGPVTADLGDTSCKVPFAPDYIRKIESRGGL